MTEISTDRFKTSKYEPENFEPHRFDLDVARDFGINAAIVYEYISARCALSYNRDKSVDLPLSILLKQWPYLGAKQIRNAIDRLAHPANGIIYKSKSPHGYNCRYALRGKSEATAIRYFFCANLAKRVGIVPAIVHQNLAYRITDNWCLKWTEYVDALKAEFHPADLYPEAIREAREWARHKITPVNWTKIGNVIPLRVVERAFGTLRAAGLIKLLRYELRTPVWTLPDKELNRFSCNWLKCIGLKMPTAKRTYPPPKRHVHRQNGISTAKRADRARLKCKRRRHLRGSHWSTSLYGS